ncbi:hypothetical protein V9T40_014316 [Parthenolecanium corni]|uniref:CRAL-TRIO domain-containing protein n=1 Tax=Parthenolecanium corni TaxID=536013 RepID=A0AAN9XY58_9HEMI
MNIEIEFPSDEDLVDIYAEFNATKETVKRDVKYLMEWLEKQPHLPNVKGYELLPLPKLTPEKRRVVIHAISPLAGIVPVKAECIVKLYTSLWDISVKADASRSYIIVYDFANMNSSFATTILSTWKLALQLLMVVFLSKSRKDLVEVLPRNILPSNYGGEEPSLTELKVTLLKYLDDYSGWLQSADINDKADLRKLPRYSDPDNIDSAYGLNGSFRNISFD